MAKHSKRRKKVTKVQAALWLIGFIVMIAAAIGLLAWGIFYLVRPHSDSGTVTATTPPAAMTTTTAATTVPTTAVPTTVVLSGGHYVQPAGAQWNLRLANDWNTLPDDYDKQFTAVEYGGGLSAKLFDSRAVQALRDMLAAGNKENAALRLQPVSCYRTVANQKSLYERQVKYQLSLGYTQEKAEEVAATIVKRPGQSEHNTGLAADLGGSGDYSLNTSFENTAAFRWLTAHCAEYGFVLRFPKNKEAITGVIYEPWHYRYVGVEAAKEMQAKGLCLEEYLEIHGY